MNDHVHVVLTPSAGFELSRIVQSWKSFTGHRLPRLGRRRAPVWQSEYFDRIVRDTDELEEKVRYVHMNPWRRWPSLEAYRWVFPQRATA
jgi:REP element-mobilizing transposase RayT